MATSTIFLIVLFQNVICAAIAVYIVSKKGYEWKEILEYAVVSLTFSYLGLLISSGVEDKNKKK